ncbi:DUF5908 family protein [Fibrobacter succinogenes]|uniref:Uncharacterized protein n=1 Tax=Fibrobacter succinogenes TaxID=833 RepID=A0A380RUW2_FIBSU|nr:hypothetical protein [Fibrobacter succinogenes]PWJ36836.1 hypothetical protein IE02_0311 [Fibrobacter succinogenes subsp. elongatus]SUQ19085.1 hypothetical protein SAMN05661053_0311 [Fibrobacter succinogenes]
MSLEIKNFVVNIHVTGSSKEGKKEDLEALRSEILDECREMISESVERMRER